MIIIVFLFYFDRFSPSHCKIDQQCLLSSFKETIIKGLAQEISKPCFNVSSLTKQREEIFKSRFDSNNKINVMVVDLIKTYYNGNSLHKTRTYYSNEFIT